VANDRDLERPQRREDELKAESPRQEEEASLRAPEEERGDAARFAAISEAMKEALENGTIAEDRLRHFSRDEQAALEALAVAKSGSNKAQRRRDFNYVSAFERKRLLNNALAELQPLLASAQSSEAKAIHDELHSVRELVQETRHDIAQRVLLETAKGGIKKQDEELDEDAEEADDDGDGDDEASEADAKKKPGGFLSLLKGARRRKKDGKSDASSKPKNEPQGGRGGSTL